jgi:hypothetical protein
MEAFNFEPRKENISELAESQGACSVGACGNDDNHELIFRLYRASVNDSNGELESADRQHALFILDSIHGTYLTADASSLHH